MNTSPATALRRRARAAAQHSVLPDRKAAETIACEAAAIERRMRGISLDLAGQIAALKEAAKSQLESLKRDYDARVAQLNTWAVVNRNAEFGDAKTITLAGHKLSFRDSPGKVTFEKGLNEEAVIQALLNLADQDFADLFLRYTTELNRESIAEHWDEEGHILKNLGIRLSKPEIFTFVSDRDAAAKAPTAAAIPQTSADDSVLKEAA